MELSMTQLLETEAVAKELGIHYLHIRRPLIEPGSRVIYGIANTRGWTVGYVVRSGKDIPPGYAPDKCIASVAIVQCHSLNTFNKRVGRALVTNLLNDPSDPENPYSSACHRSLTDVEFSRTDGYVSDQMVILETFTHLMNSRSQRGKAFERDPVNTAGNRKVKTRCVGSYNGHLVWTTRSDLAATVANDADNAYIREVVLDLNERDLFNVKGVSNA